MTLDPSSKLWIAVACLLTCLSLPSASWAQSNGLVAVQSAHDVATTVERLRGIVQEREMTIFQEIDHAAAAESVGETLRPTRLLLFGTPSVGSRLMGCRQSIGIDLPMKFLVWRDEADEVWIGFNDPDWLAGRHTMTGCRELLEGISSGLSSMAIEAASEG